ncbi:MAG TPA: Fe-S cluster assembly protein SufB, partial [Puia sp.]|nr:Fe-S cluster assembly protein SufB [Puia sp.]
MNDVLMSTIEKTVLSDYKYGFVSNINAEEAPKGLNEDIIRFISAKKQEPQWLLDWRIKAYRQWLKMEEPKWPNVTYPPIDYQDIIYYSAPKQRVGPNSIDDIDPELKRTFDKLGISLDEQKRLTGVAVDVVVDSISVATSFKEQLADLGIIFCSISEAVQKHP